MKTIYYYYYTFYSKFLAEANPHFTTVLALSFAESLIINIILSLGEIYYYCFNASKWQGISICVLLILINYSYYVKNGNGKAVIDDEPKILGNATLSIVLTALFTILSVYTLFKMGDWELALLKNC